MSSDPLPRLTPRIIYVRGTHYQMGFQHARQLTSLMPAIHEAVDTRFAQVATDRPDAAFEQVIQNTIAILQAHDPATLAVIRGLADGLAIDFERLLRYNLITFLRDILTTAKASSAGNPALDEGCSTWAATSPATVSGYPILVKNRDFSLLHLPLQVVVRAEPEHGYRYTYITSAGSPGVFVAGFNEAGLALVDTHVSSTDVGPGLPTFALSMHILEDHTTVRSALNYLKVAPRLGRNNVLLADASGDIALFEIGNQHYAIQEADMGLLVNTNHFICKEMKPYYVDTDVASIRGNSLERHALLIFQLKRAHGNIDLAFSQDLMGSHSKGLSSICRHPHEGQSSSTISASIFLPAQQRLFFCHGFPCAGEYISLGYEE